MKNGVVRQIDNLGRIVIPKGVRDRCGIKVGDPLEICHDEKAQTVTLKRYKTEDELHKELREEWVNKRYKEFYKASAFSKRVGNMTIVAWYGDIATTVCRKGDQYDRKVGEAICFAKLNGESIPDYI